MNEDLPLLAGKEPTTEDGRNVHPLLALLEGEAAQQKNLAPPKQGTSLAPGAKRFFAPSAESPTYYGLPVLKEPVWKWPIPVYFFVGGVAAASGVVADLAVRIRGERLESLGAKARVVQLAGVGVSTACLIYDLGRPSRFVYMLRVFRPTSPMNVGAWILSAVGATATAAALFEVLGVRPLASVFSGASAVASLPLATYTAVLLSNTVVPAWAEAERALPWLFAAGAIAGAAAVLDLLPLEADESSLVQRLGVLGKAAELIASQLVEREAGRVIDRVSAPYREGVSGALWRGAEALTLAGLVTSLVPRAPKWLRRISAGISLAGALAMRFAVSQAGTASARDPRASFELQRAKARDPLARRVEARAPAPFVPSPEPSPSPAV